MRDDDLFVALLEVDSTFCIILFGENSHLFGSDMCNLTGEALNYFYFVIWNYIFINDVVNKKHITL